MIKITFARNGEHYIGLSELITLHSMTKDEKRELVNKLTKFLQNCDSASTNEVTVTIFPKN